MNIYKIEPVGFAANSYLLTVDGKTAVAIDPAQESILTEAKSRGLEVKFALFTHGHFDHIGGASILQKAGAKVGCLEEEKNLALYDNLGSEMGGMPVPPFTVDFTFRSGEVLTLCGMNFTVLGTAGHTAGSVCFVCENVIFTGDTLFASGVGRTDLPTGNYHQLLNSLKKLCALEGDYKLYCGHGDDTTLDEERQNNPYLEGLC